MVDDLPLLSTPERRGARRGPAADGSSPGTASAATAASASRAGAASAAASWSERLDSVWRDFGGHLWQRGPEACVRVTRIDQPDAMLVAPEQAFFLRENLKLRLLNARLALLSRQFDTAQSDLRDAQAALDRYFDRSSRRVVAASDLVRQVVDPGAPGQPCRARTTRWPPRRRFGRALTPACIDMRSIIWLMLLFAGGGGGGHHAGTERRPGQRLLGRLADRSVAQPVRDPAAGQLRAGDVGGQGDRLARQPAASRRANGARCAASAPRRLRCAKRWPSTSAARYGRAHKAAERALAIQPTTPQAGAGRRVHASWPTCWPRAACTACRTASAATRPCAWRSRPAAARAAARAASRKAHACWPPNGRWTTATRGARIELLRSPAAGCGAAHPGPAPEAAGARAWRVSRWRRCTRRGCSPSTGAFSAVVAQGLLRSLAVEALDSCARPAAIAPRCGSQFDAADRRDAIVAARAAHARGAARSGRRRAPWLRPFWDRLAELAREDREQVALALIDARAGIGVDWLPRLESAAQAFGHESAVVAAVGHGLGRAPALGQGAPTARAGGRGDPALAASARRARLAPARGAGARGRPMTRSAAALRAGGRGAGLIRAQPGVVYFYGCAAVAQLDRVLGYEPRGRGFESCQPHHQYQRASFHKGLARCPLGHPPVESGADDSQ